MEVVELVGRLLFVALFLFSGLGHFAKRQQMVEYSRSSGVPAPALTVPLTGIMLLVGGVLIAVGVWADLGALLLVVFLIPTAYYMHAYWKVEDPQMRAMQQAHFMKNIALAGAALVLLYLFQHFGEAVELTAGGPLF